MEQSNGNADNTNTNNISDVSAHSLRNKILIPVLVAIIPTIILSSLSFTFQILKDKVNTTISISNPSTADKEILDLLKAEEGLESKANGASGITDDELRRVYVSGAKIIKQIRKYQQVNEDGQVFLKQANDSYVSNNDAAIRHSYQLQRTLEQRRYNIKKYDSSENEMVISYDKFTKFLYQEGQKPQEERYGISNGKEVMIITKSKSNSNEWRIKYFYQEIDDQNGKIEVFNQ